MNNEKKVTDDIAKDVENCTKVFTLSEFSRETGIRIELLRRFINRQTRQVRAETWDKISPSIMELLGENDCRHTKRVGPPYRRHAELVEMVSDQKVLLDVYNVLSPAKQQAVIKSWEEKAASKPTAFTSLSADENKLMGSFLAMAPEVRESELLALIRDAREEIASRR